MPVFIYYSYTWGIHNVCLMVFYTVVMYVSVWSTIVIIIYSNISMFYMILFRHNHAWLTITMVIVSPIIGNLDS